MTKEQFRNWYTFSIRMAHRGWPQLPRKSRKKVACMVKEFFRTTMRDFDDKDYPLIPRIRSWDETDDPVGKKDYYGRQDIGPYVCDMVDEQLSAENPYYHYHTNWQYERWDELWGCRFRCCLRAGLDLASSPSAGVIGFEVCDLRRMYRGKIPAWINDGDWKNSKTEKVDLNQGECAVGIWL